MMPPALLRLQVNGFGIWLPIVLLWPFLFLLAPFVFLAGLFTLRPLDTVEAFFGLLAALRGLSVRVDQPGNSVNIQFW